MRWEWGHHATRTPCRAGGTLTGAGNGSGGRNDSGLPPGPCNRCLRTQCCERSGDLASYARTVERQPRGRGYRSAGLARTAWTIGSSVGDQEVTATAVTVTGPMRAIFATTAVAGPAAELSLSPDSLLLGVSGMQGSSLRPSIPLAIRSPDPLRSGAVRIKRSRPPTGQVSLRAYRAAGLQSRRVSESLVGRRPFAS